MSVKLIKHRFGLSKIHNPKNNWTYEFKPTQLFDLKEEAYDFATNFAEAYSKMVR